MDGYARCRTGTVCKNGSTGGNHSLAFLVIRHPAVAVMTFYPIFNSRFYFCMIFQGSVHNFGPDDLRHIASVRVPLS